MKIISPLIPVKHTRHLVAAYLWFIKGSNCVLLKQKITLNTNICRIHTKTQRNSVYLFFVGYLLPFRVVLFSSLFFFLLSSSRLKYSITTHEGSGQTQEAELIGSTRISMGMCDQSLLPPRAPPPPSICSRVCVSNRCSPRRSPVSTHLLTIASC